MRGVEMRKSFWAAIVLGLGIASISDMLAQKGGSPPPADSGPVHDPIAKNSSTVNLSTLADPETVRREIEQAAKEAKVERQKRILKDTDKLVKLATELKAQADTASDQVPTDMVRKTEQIEKLAHNVAQRTRKK
jgi:hypothetical protein